MTRQPGLDGRQRDMDGKIRSKNGNTLIAALRETYGEGFADGHRGDMKLGTLLILREDSFDASTKRRDFGAFGFGGTRIRHARFAFKARDFPKEWRQ